MLVWQDALLLTGLSWTHRCTLPPPDEVASPLPWRHTFPAVSVRDPPALAVGSYNAFCNNVGGAHNQTEVLPAVIQTLDPDFVIL